MVQFWSIFLLREERIKILFVLVLFLSKGFNMKRLPSSNNTVKVHNFSTKKTCFLKIFFIQKSVQNVFLKIKKGRKPLPLSPILALQKACNKLCFWPKIWPKKASFLPKNIASNWAFFYRIFLITKYENLAFFITFFFFEHAYPVFLRNIFV